jgi:hypothetical protein
VRPTRPLSRASTSCSVRGISGPSGIRRLPCGLRIGRSLLGPCARRARPRAPSRAVRLAEAGSAQTGASLVQLGNRVGFDALEAPGPTESLSSRRLLQPNAPFSRSRVRISGRLSRVRGDFIKVQFNVLPRSGATGQAPTILPLPRSGPPTISTNDRLQRWPRARAERGVLAGPRDREGGPSSPDGQPGLFWRDSELSAGSKPARQL